MPDVPLFYGVDLDDALRATAARRHAGEDAIYVHAPCHPGAGLDVAYHAGVLTLACARCDRAVARIAVQARPEG